jgi:2'-5' RNA ligase
LADELRQIRRGLGDPEDSPAHITLLPPTPVAACQVETVASRIARRAEQFGTFRVHLRGTATFRPVSPVVYAELVEGFNQCLALEALIRPAVGQTEQRFPYYPHVTVANGCDDQALDQAQSAMAYIDTAFRVEAVAFCLLNHDGNWRDIRHLALGGDRQMPLDDAAPRRGEAA